MNEVQLICDVRFVYGRRRILWSQIRLLVL